MQTKTQTLNTQNPYLQKRSLFYSETNKGAKQQKQKEKRKIYLKSVKITSKLFAVERDASKQERCIFFHNSQVGFRLQRKLELKFGATKQTKLWQLREVLQGLRR